MRGHLSAAAVTWGLLLAGTPARGAVGWTAGGRVGGGFDDNVNAAPSRDEAMAASSWSAGGSLGGWWALGRTRLQLGLAYEHAGFLDLPALAQDVARASLGVSVPLAWHVRLSAAPFGAIRWYGDTERDALDVGGSARVTWRMLPRLTGSMGGRYTWRSAAISVYDRSALGGGADLELRLGKATFPVVAYDVEYGQAVFYGEIIEAAVARGTGTGGPDGSGSGSGEGDGPDSSRKPADAPSTTTDTFGTTLVAWSEPALTQVVSIGVEQGIGRQFFAEARAGLAWVVASTSTRDRFVSVGVGVRLP